jgi:mannose-1-phosphate guanylyltransferase
MVERLINTLPSEIDRVILAVSYMVDMLKEHFEKPIKGREIILVEEKEPLGTGGAIKNVEKHIDSTFLTFNGDVICSLDFNAILEFHKKSGGSGTISMWEVEDPTRYGIIGVDTDSKITRFLEKPKKEEAFSNWINAGVYVLEPDILDLMKPDSVISIEREIFPPLAEQGRLYGFKFQGFWVDAGTPFAYLKAHRTLLEKGTKTPMKYPENVKFNPPVIMGEDCTISENSQLGPNTCIGDGVTVGRKSKISNSVILNNVKIGENVYIDHAIVGNECTIEDEAVLGEYVVVGDKQVISKGSKIQPHSNIGGP